MRANFEKFLFLGVMVVLTFFFNQKTYGNLASLGEAFTVSAESHQTVFSGQNSEGLVTVGTIESGDQKVLNGTSENLSSEEDGISSEINEIITTPKVDKNELLKVGKETSTPSLTSQAQAGSPDGGFFSGGAEVVGSVTANPFRKYGEEKPNLGLAEAVLVSDLLTGEVYFSLNPDKRWPTASITKLMTAAAVFQKNTLNAQVDGGVILAGEKYTAYDLLEKMLISSSNEAAEVLATFYGYSDFMVSMNSMAKGWSLSETFFKDPVGISVSNQSTAFDLQRIVKRIYDTYPDVLKITRRKSADVTEINLGRKQTVLSNNEFAGQVDFLGGKTGYTEDALENLVSIFSYNKRPLLIIILGTQDRFGQTEGLFSWFKRNYK
ncbi:MAG: D-alanyl-D-alanine carboxypeptidase [Parcubacteria group bacterium Gr01-1014_20]|nr:MAG: D-alanyl-D-alanine carboxypeptidase [Parcubacteria group bacterium Gr01-1014_20]